MKKAFLKIIVLCFSLMLTEQAIGQNVQTCLAINGTAMPASRNYFMCDKPTNNQPYIIPGAGATSVTLSLTNCAASPETNVTYTWKNLSVGASLDSVHSTITVKDTEKWEATILNNVTMLSYKDTLHLMYYPHIAVAVHGPYDPAKYSNFAVQGCPLYTINLTTTSSGPITARSWYTVSPFGVIPGETSSTYSFYIKDQKYLAVVKDVNNCVNFDTSQYYNLNTFKINVNLGPDPAAPICENTSYNLVSTVPFGYNIGPGANYTVYYGVDGVPQPSTTYTVPASPAAGFPGPAAGIDIKNILIPGTHKYFLKIQNFPRCDGADTVSITVNPIPVVDIGPASVLACYGNNTTITANVSVGTAPYSYAWSPGSFPTTSGSIVISPTAPTTYTLQVTDVNNCSFGTDNILINVTPEIIFTISPDVTICRYPLDSTSLSVVTPVSGGTGPYSYAWSPTTGLSTNVTTTSVKAAPVVTTPYTLKVTDNMSCTSTRTVNVTSYKPAISISSSSNFSGNPPYIINETHPATYTISTASGNQVEWKNGDNNTSVGTTSALALEYSGPDTINYVAIVTDPAAPNCMNYDTIAVWSISENTLLYVPNIFSPNATNPENQKFRIYGDNLAPDDFKILVYNKWGNLVYESTDLMDTKANGWDGGSKIEGVYTYVIVGKFKNGKDVNESKFNKGTFSLIK